jgi:hypothetical protein
MSDGPLTEAVPVPCLFVTGASIEVTEHIMRFIGWVHLPDLGGETDERRIVVRFAMPIDVARRLRDDLTGMLRKGR